MARLRGYVHGRRLQLAAVFALAFAGLLVGNEITLARDAASVAARIGGHALEDLAGAWVTYDEFSDRSHLGFAAEALRTALTRRTQGLASEVIGDYRESTIVHGRRWTLLRDALARAVAANPNSAELRAALRYCEGHLHRQNGEARLNESKDAAAEQELRAAISNFRAAAELRPRWPDPFLGLFRTFVIGLGDMERGLDALMRAEALGYIRAPREIAQLAQGFEQRGRNLELVASRAPAAAPVNDYLSQAARAYRQSLSLYEMVPAYGNAMQRVRIISDRLDRIEQRTTEPFQ